MKEPLQSFDLLQYFYLELFPQMHLNGTCKSTGFGCDTHLFLISNGNETTLTGKKRSLGLVFLKHGVLEIAPY